VDGIDLKVSTRIVIVVSEGKPGIQSALAVKKRAGSLFAGWVRHGRHRRIDNGTEPFRLSFQ